MLERSSGLLAEREVYVAVPSKVLRFLQAKEILKKILQNQANKNSRFNKLYILKNLKNQNFENTKKKHSQYRRFQKVRIQSNKTFPSPITSNSSIIPTIPKAF